MINTVEALQGLYVALGGDITDVANVTTIPEMLTAISTVAPQGASELPKTTTDDNDMVLTVVNGKWDKAAVSGGGASIFNITFSTNDDGETFTVDKTYSEILAAYNAGNIIRSTIPDTSIVTGKTVSNIVFESDNSFSFNFFNFAVNYEGPDQTTHYDDLYGVRLFVYEENNETLVDVCKITMRGVTVSE